MAEPTNKGTEGTFECPKCHAKRHIRRGEGTRCQTEGCDGIMIRTAGGSTKKLLPFIIGGVLLVSGIAVGITHIASDNPIEKKDSLKTDTTKPQPPKPPIDNYPDSFPYYVSYGIYKGQTKNGYAEGQGELIFTERHLINNKDKMLKRTAEKDWKIQGEFYHGFFLFGDLYNEKGELVAVFHIGETNNAESEYDEPLKPRKTK